MNEAVDRFSSSIWPPASFEEFTVTSQRESARFAPLPRHSRHTFTNPFQIEDLLVFDQDNLGRVLAMTHIVPEHLGWSLQKAPPVLVQQVFSCLSDDQQVTFFHALSDPIAEDDIAQARHLLLDKLFWELTYWKTPELYAELVAGEHLHPGIFQQLEPLLRHKIVLDAGAGCGRATFAALEYGVRQIYAVEPSPGLRRLFAEKLAASSIAIPVVLRAGDFAHTSLPDRSVDLVLTCSAFIADPAQGGEPGLTELQRVTRPGGSIVLIWPRPRDRSWLAEHGFRYSVLPQDEEMGISFSSWQSAWRCAQRFYAGNMRVAAYLRHARQPRLPFSVLGMNAPCDYCWLPV